MTPDDVMGNLKWLFRILGTGLERATQQARDYFSKVEKPIDRVLASHMARYWMLEHLKGHRGLEVDLQVEKVPNNGLSIYAGGHPIRIWKTNDGEVPHPGLSERKASFLRQEPPTPNLRQSYLFDNPTKVAQPNLVVMWEVDQDYGLKSLSVACPRPGVEGTVAEEWDWKMPIPEELWTGAVEDTLEITDAEDPYTPRDQEDEQGDERQKEPGS